MNLGRLALARSTVDRAADRRRDPQWLARAWADPCTRVLVVDDGRALVRFYGEPGDGGTANDTARGRDGGWRGGGSYDDNAAELILVPSAEAPDGARIFLGVDAAVAYFAVLAPLQAEPSAAGHDPVRPGAFQPSALQPGAVQGGTFQPGAVQPGAVQEGAVEPGAVQPGAVQGGAVQGGAVQGGAVQPGAVQVGLPGPGVTGPGDAGPGAALGAPSKGAGPARPGGVVRRAGLRAAGALLNDRDAGLLTHTVALANWHATHTYCPRCGARTRLSEAGHTRTCPEDGSEHFPRVDPAVIMLVLDSADRCLLARNLRWPEKRVSILAGFVEPGESIEQAVVREVREEVGLTVGELRYLGSQPWPLPQSLMLGFSARVGGPGQFGGTPEGQIRVDADEIAEARWYSREDLRAAIGTGRVLLPAPVSIAHRIIQAWYGSPLPKA